MTKKHKSKKTILKNYYVDNYEDLTKFVQRRGVPAQDVEDVVQEAFAKALQFIKTYEEGRDFGGWFYVILENCRRDYLREEIDRGMVREDFEEEDFAIDIPELEVDFKQIKLIEDDINKKSEPLKDVLKLYFIHNYSPIDISYLVEGLSRQTIRSYISRFKQEMREKYG